jgi:hypothetical protein
MCSHAPLRKDIDWHTRTGLGELPSAAVCQFRAPAEDRLKASAVDELLNLR